MCAYLDMYLSQSYSLKFVGNAFEENSRNKFVHTQKLFCLICCFSGDQVSGSTAPSPSKECSSNWKPELSKSVIKVILSSLTSSNVSFNHAFFYQSINPIIHLLQSIHPLVFQSIGNFVWDGEFHPCPNQPISATKCEQSDKPPQLIKASFTLNKDYDIIFNCI